MKRFWVLAAAMALIAATPVAQTMMYELRGSPLFTMRLPIGWTIFTEYDEDLAARPEGADPMPLLISARPRAGQLWYGTWLVDKIDDFDEAQDYVRSLTEYLFENRQISDFKTGVHNGMEFRYYEGSAVYVREVGKEVLRDDVDFFAAFFKPGDKGVGISLYVGVPSATEEYREVLAESLRSIRPYAASVRSD